MRLKRAPFLLFGYKKVFIVRGETAKNKQKRAYGGKRKTRDSTKKERIAGWNDKRQKEAVKNPRTADYLLCRKNPLVSILKEKLSETALKIQAKKKTEENSSLKAAHVSSH